MAESGDKHDMLLNQLVDEFAARQRCGERPSLEEYCERYPDLAADIRSLFPAMAELEQAKADAGPDLAVAVADAPVVTQLGDFRLLREIGRGGMGVVYEAEQVSLGRRVAIKLLPSTVFRDPAKRRRFEREAKAAAKLHHTNIVPVHGFGEHDRTPYYVMQFIPGLGLDMVIEELSRLPAAGGAEPGLRPVGAHSALSVALAQSLLGDAGAITTGHDGAGDLSATMTAAGAATPDPAAADSSALARSGRSSSVSLSASGVQLPGQSKSGVGGSTGKKLTYWESVARIGVQVAGALAYAHKLGVLHRDIKPANLLLDVDGTVWVTDFGLAKADDSDNLTHTGDLLGTFRYMPPEAFEGKSDARSDVYSLGLTLFELVALRPAYEERDRNKLIKQVTTGEPPRLRKLRKDAPRDLVTIVEKAIDRDPSRRYQTAGSLADDLQRYLDGRPITARRATELERLWMWARRRPATAALVVALFLCLLAGSIIATVFAIRADRFARDAVLRERDATVARDAAGRSADEATQTRNAAARQAAGLLLDRGIEDARGGEPARALHLFVRALRTLPTDDPQAAPLEAAIRANLSAWAETVPALEWIWPGRVEYQDVAFSPDGGQIALNAGKDELQCFQTDTGRPVGPPARISDGGSTEAMAFAPDARSVWVASPGSHVYGAKKWQIHRFDPLSGRLGEPIIETTGPVHKLIPTPDGQYLVGAVLGLHPDDHGPAANAVGTRIWRTASIVVWDMASGRVVRKVDVNADNFNSTFMGLSADGKSVTAMVQGQSNAIKRMTFAVNGNEPPASVALRLFESGVPFAFSFQNNMRTAIVIKGGQLHRWSAANPEILGPGIPTPFRMVYSEPSPDGRMAISFDERRAFDIGAWPPRRSGVRLAHSDEHDALVDARIRHGLGGEQFSPDGRFVATWPVFGGGIERRLWRLPRPYSRNSRPLTELARLPEQTKYFHFARLDGNGTAAVLWRYEGGAYSREVRIVDAATGAARGISVRHANRVRVVEFSPDGRYFATASHDCTVRVWETATGRPAGPRLVHTNFVADVAFSPDGNTLAAGDYGPNGLIKLWNWRTGKEIRPSLWHNDIVINVSFSRDGRYVAALKTPDWSQKPELILWDIASGTAVFRTPHHYARHRFFDSSDTTVSGLRAQFRPDSRAVAALDSNGILRLWEVPSGKLLGERPLGGATVTRFSPDGRVIAVAANLGVRLLDADTLNPLPGGYLPHPDPIDDLSFSPDGTLLLVGYESGSAQLWDVSTRKPLGPPAVMIAPIRAVTFTPDSKTCVCVAADGTVRRWPAPSPLVEPDLDRLADRVALMTGQRMENLAQGLDFIPLDEWRALRTRLVGDGSTALAPPRADADWHDTVAADAEQDGDVFGAEWRLVRLAALRPGDWTVPARHGRILANAGRRDEAATAYDRAARLAPSPQVLADWFRAAATDCEAAGRNETALWNLDRAIALTPADWTLYVLRAGLADPARAAADLDEAIRRGAEPNVTLQAAVRAGESGEWKRAAALLRILTRWPTLPTSIRFLHVLACLKAGDAAGYRAACAGIAKRLESLGPRLSPREANEAATAFALAPNATDDWAKPLAWIDFTLKHLDAIEKTDPDKKLLVRRERSAYLNTRGAVLYRAGRFEEAAKVLREGMSFQSDGGEIQDWGFLALIEHRLGHADVAREAAVKARAALRNFKANTAWQKAEIDLLTAELDAALPPMSK